MPSSAEHYPPGQQQQQQQLSVIQKWARVRPDTLQDLLARQRGTSSVHHGGGTNQEDKDCHHLPIVAAGLDGPLCVLARQQHGHLVEVPVGHQQRNFGAPAGKRRQLGDGWEAPPMGRRQLLQDFRQELDMILHLSGHRESHIFFVWIFGISRFWYEFSENFDFGQNVRKIQILVKISEKSRFLVKILENLDFRQNNNKSQFWWKFWKISIFRFFWKISMLVKSFGKSPFWSKFGKILILVKISKNLDFGENYREISVWVKISKTSLLVRIFGKSGLRYEFSENLHFGENFRKISILVKIMESLDSAPNCRQISILVKISKNLDFGKQLSEKSRFCSKFWKIFDFDQNCRKISIFVKIIGNSPFPSKFSETSIFVWNSGKSRFWCEY